MLTNSCQIVSEIQANTGLEPVTSDRSGVLITWCCTLIMMEQWQGTHKSHYILTGSRKFPPSGLPVDYEQGLQDIKLTISALIEHVNTYSAELSTCINKYSTTMSIITNQYTYHGRPSDSLPHLTMLFDNIWLTDTRDSYSYPDYTLSSHCSTIAQPT